MKKIVIVHGFMCNGKTTYIEKFHVREENTCIIKDKSQNVVNKYFSDITGFEIQELILISSVNFFYTFFEQIIPKLTCKKIYLDRDLYDTIIYTKIMHPDDKILNETLDQILQRYKSLQNNYDVEHYLLEDIMNIDICLETEKRVLALEQVRNTRDIPEENKLTLKDLMLLYNDLYNKEIKKLIPDIKIISMKDQI